MICSINNTHEYVDPIISDIDDLFRIIWEMKIISDAYERESKYYINMDPCVLQYIKKNKNYEISVKRFLLKHINKSNINMCYKKYNMNTILSSIIPTQSVELVKLCIDIGADVNIHNITKDTPLITACGYSNTEIVKLLIDCGANVNSVNNHNMSALYMSVCCKKIENVKILIDAKADVNIRTKYSYSALDWILANSYKKYAKKIIKLLIDAGSDIDVHTEPCYMCTYLKYNGFAFLNIPTDEKTIEYYSHASKAYPNLLKHLCTYNVSNIIQILPFKCQFYYYLFNKEVIDIIMAIRIII